MGRSTRQCGAQRGDGGASLPPAARKVVPEACLPEPQYGRTAIPPLRENERGRRPAVRIQVVPRKRFALSPMGIRVFLFP